MTSKVLTVAAPGVMVAAAGAIALARGYEVGPVTLGLALIPLAALILSGRDVRGAAPDIVFGSIDTGLLTIPAVWGGVLFGVAGAIAGGVIGDALTDAVAGFFEGGVAQWLRSKGIEESREPVTTALGKMTGCLAGAGLVLTAALALGVEISFK